MAAARAIRIGVVLVVMFFSVCEDSPATAADLLLLALPDRHSLRGWNSLQFIETEGVGWSHSPGLNRRPGEVRSLPAQPKTSFARRSKICPKWHSDCNCR